ncbi:MAG TPA: FAD-dependent monooxygenase [Bryobacteraceae bacterium]|nr:FAD-dependent monooxygenase [Bryobacteraceae bacterium]
MTLEVDVLVVGAGPAGATAALNLAGRRRVLLIDYRTPGARPVGESLAPAARRLLTDMGLWEEFQAQGHAPCYGHRSVWGGPEVVEADSLRDPDGPGWHVDRERFDGWLRDVAAARGAMCLAPARVEGLEWDGAGWEVRIRGRVVRARVVIDAAGRFAPVARRLGAKRETDGRLICAWQLGRAREAEGMTFVEAVRDGWWYSAPLPEGRRVVAYHTDQDLPRDGVQGPHLESLLRACGFVPEGVRRLMVASGGMSRPCAGPGWFAAGDAAVRFDPLSAQGIFNALYTGLAAALSADEWLRGDRTAVHRYCAEIEFIFGAYQAHCRQWYRLERRWPAALFWARR